MTDPTRPLRVMIVDDYDMTRALLRVILRSDRYDVVGEATSGAQCLEMAARLRPDIVLLDIHMPDGSGLEILGRLKRLLPASSVVMVSSRDDDQAMRQALLQGAKGYVIKPFNTESVLGTMNDVRSKFLVAQPASLQKN